MSKNKKIISVVVGIIVLVGVFFIGASYGKSGTVASSATNGATAGAGQFGRGNRTGAGGAGGFISGKIISKDANSITVELANMGPASATSASPTGSEIIFLDTTTPITKTTTGSLSDLAVGTQVSITGTPNSDGSVTAKSVQIRPQIKPSAPTQ